MIGSWIIHSYWLFFSFMILKPQVEELKHLGILVSSDVRNRLLMLYRSVVVKRDECKCKAVDVLDNLHSNPHL